MLIIVINAVLVVIVQIVMRQLYNNAYFAKKIVTVINVSEFIPKDFVKKSNIVKYVNSIKIKTMSVVKMNVGVKIVKNQSMNHIDAT